MQPGKGGPEPGGWEWPKGAGPPAWLLPAGCATVGLILAGALIGGDAGEIMTGLGCLALPSLAGIFVALLLWRSSGEGRNGPGTGPRDGPGSGRR